MTPHFTVLMVDWKSRVSSSILGYFFYFSTAKFASTFEINFFLNHFSNFSVSCIGHSLGAHMCGSICRNFKKISSGCDKIVGLDVASPGFWKKGDELIDNRLSKNDAKYVAALMSGTKLGGLSDFTFAHEYITTNIDGKENAECPPSGKFSSTLCATNIDYNRICVNFSIGNGFGFSCSHTMAVLIFAKSLDIFSSLSVIGLRNFNSSFVISSWNGYSMSEDARFPIINGEGWLSSNESAYYPKHVMMINIFSNESYNVSIKTKYGSMNRIYGMNNTWIVFGDDMLDKSYFRFESNIFIKINWIRIYKSRIVPINGKLELSQIYKESRKCYNDRYFESYCIVGESKMTIVPRNTSVTFPFDEIHCRSVFPFSYLISNNSYTLLGQIYKEIRINLKKINSIDYVTINNVTVINWGRRCINIYNVKIENGILVMKFLIVGKFNVTVYTPFSKLEFNVIVGKPTLTLPIFFKSIRQGESVTLKSAFKFCHTAKWYKNGISVGIGCEFNATVEGHYKFVAEISNRYVIERDFEISYNYELMDSKISVKFMISVMISSLSIGLMLGISIVMMIFCCFRKF
uniref:Lipase n=1 Tax=Pacific black duck aviadenovirus TaxID=2798287 RepID=A0A7T4S074_9ADEN|nr:lipase [Pacific black duck aviadenovirus]